jgi:hypothetical protein
MNDRPWAELWGDFRREAARFDEDKLLALFGQRDPVPAPDGDPGNWTERQRLYVGEFVRRHHARLAHEIALVGVPGPGENRICFPSADDRRWFIDLVGFIARSHHLNLRAAADRMPKGSKRDFRGVHAPFVMAILRIADYIEISAPRAPSALLGVKRLRSPFSRQEWRKHAAVVHVKLAEEDPEALWVDAEPSDVKTFLGLQSLFRGIQSELDATWATLGEVYGADPKLQHLGLVVRRIRSTLDDLEAFGKQVNYLPVQASFRVAGGDVLKLLIAPLYGENPSFGVRELMQNAVDACREREDFAAQNPHKNIELAELEADVVVHVELQNDGTGWLTVEDRGIGMTRDVVLNYFLTAGASFRNSDSWHRQHDDTSGHSRIPRAGRFGVGVLAAFLIGDEIYVSTRNVGEARGIEFSCRLEDREVELKWTSRRVGTTVRIKISNPKVGSQLRGHGGSTWDWYGLDAPTLVRKISITDTGESTKCTCRLRLPAPNESEPTAWASIHVDDLDAVHWSWTPDPLRANYGTYACNGFYLNDPVRIPGSAYIALWEPNHLFSQPVARPFISVLDNQGCFPVNLIRTDLTRLHTSIEQKLLPAVCRDILASLLVRLPTSADVFWHEVFRRGERTVLPYEPERTRRAWHSFCTNQRGVRILDGTTAEDIFSDVVHCTFGTMQLRRRDNKVASDWGLRFGLADSWRCEVRGFHDRDPIRQLEKLIIRNHRSTGEIFSRFSALLIIDKFSSSNASEMLLGDFATHFDSDIIDDRWLLMWRGEDKRQVLMLDQLKALDSDTRADPLLMLFGPNSLNALLNTLSNSVGLGNIEPSPLAQAWRDFIRHPVIPWALDERQDVLAHAYRELHDEVQRWTRFVKNKRQ